jgi:hypothetical protein
MGAWDASFRHDSSQLRRRMCAYTYDANGNPVPVPGRMLSTGQMTSMKNGTPALRGAKLPAYSIC